MSADLQGWINVAATRQELINELKAEKRKLAAEVGRLRGVAPRLRAFGRDCVYHGDMTPGAQRMLDAIAAEYDS